jgi:hypothetical protein
LGDEAVSGNNRLRATCGVVDEAEDGNDRTSASDEPVFDVAESGNDRL